MWENLSQEVLQLTIWASVAHQVQTNSRLQANTKSSSTSIKTIQKYWVRDISHRAKNKLSPQPLLTTPTTQQSTRRIVQTAERAIIRAARASSRKISKWFRASPNQARWRSRLMAQGVYLLINSISRVPNSGSHLRSSRILISKTIYFKSTIGVRSLHRNNRCSRSIARVALAVLRYTE